MYKVLRETGALPWRSFSIPPGWCDPLPLAPSRRLPLLARGHEAGEDGHLDERFYSHLRPISAWLLF